MPCKASSRLVDYANRQLFYAMRTLVGLYDFILKYYKQSIGMRVKQLEWLQKEIIAFISSYNLLNIYNHLFLPYTEGL